jgi:hypothetical protein
MAYSVATDTELLEVAQDLEKALTGIGFTDAVRSVYSDYDHEVGWHISAKRGGSWYGFIVMGGPDDE